MPDCGSSETLILDLQIIASVQYKYLRSFLQSPVCSSKQETHGNSDLQDTVWNKVECFFLMWNNSKCSDFPVYTLLHVTLELSCRIEYFFIFKLYAVVHTELQLKLVNVEM